MVYIHTLTLLCGLQHCKYTAINLTLLMDAVRFVFYSAERRSSEMQPCVGWARLAVTAHRRTSGGVGHTTAPFQSTPRKPGCARLCEAFFHHQCHVWDWLVCRGWERVDMTISDLLVGVSEGSAKKIVLSCVTCSCQGANPLSWSWADSLFLTSARNWLKKAKCFLGL